MVALRLLLAFVALAVSRVWYEKAADLGARRAMNNLGLLYENGRGVARDPAVAKSWFEKAAALGDQLAMRNVGRVYNLSIGVPRDPAQARQWFERANAATGDDFDQAAALGAPNMAPAPATPSPPPQATPNLPRPGSRIR
jgi:TPR repeat protein